ncbi:MAG: glycoside hydrolase family 13 protein, partial [Hadesarchaea archaeon]|nr:glycoside hydrolase family 13 protein [Hadesarchaea archaeon]
MTERFRNGNPNNDAVGDGSSGDLLLKEWTTLGGLTYPDLYAKKMNWTDDVETDIPWANETAPTLGRDYFGGDLEGVREKIPYLTDLGVNAIYFNPIMEGPHTHGYSVNDYKSVCRYFGGLQAFRALMKELDANNMKVILDGVFNHCCVRNRFFDRESEYPTDGAYESKQSPWYDWFTFSTWPKEYARWGGFYHIPEINETDGYKDYVYRATDSVIKFWNDLGVDGWRLDVANQISHTFWKEFRTYCKRMNPDGYLVGEIWSVQSEWLQGDEFDGLMNYPWRGAVIGWVNGGNPSWFNSELQHIRDSYPGEAFYTLLNSLSTHDTHRILTELGGNKQKAKLAVIFQMTYPGAPCIWYGDEVGMTSDHPRGSGNKTRADPFTRRPYPWADQGYPVSAQPGVPDMDMHAHYKKLIGIRMQHPVLRTGSLKTLMADDGKRIYALGRKLGDQVAVLVYNNGGSPQTVTVDLGTLAPAGTKFIDVLNQNVKYTASSGVTLTV